MVDFDPDVLAKLKASGLYSDEQETRLQQDRRRQEERASQRRREDQQRQERNYGQQQNRRGGRGGSGYAGNRGGRPAGAGQPAAPHGIYGKVLYAHPAERPQDIATAPYNFIPLPDDVLPSPLDAAIRDVLTDGDGVEKQQLAPEEERAVQQAFHVFRTQGRHYDGASRLSIEPLTPLFIGGDGKNSFAPTGEPVIPGSELRGMTKNLMKMITCGTWRANEDMTERHLYYRCLMAPHSAPFNQDLHDLYASKMTTELSGHRVAKNAKPGFLVKRGRQYFIYPLLADDRMKSIVIRDYMKAFGVNDHGVRTSAVRWKGNRAYVQVGLMSTKGLRTKEQIEEFFRVTPPRERNRIGKQYYRHFSTEDMDKATVLEVPPEVLEEYRSDKNRRGMDLLQQNHVFGNVPTQVEGIAPFEKIIPCFYLEEDGRVKAFGHGQSFRIPYDHSTLDAVPEALKQPVVDFAEAMFGHTGKAISWASRLAFEDAVATRLAGTEPAGLAHALMQPNPTSFQLYLTQDNEEKLVHWDAAGAKIRGYKMYWHNKNGHDWKANAAERSLVTGREAGSADLLKTIAPLKAGAKFEGRIRFRDLDAAELGALCKCFHIAKNGEDIAYKIGMGKSIGLGSIRVQATLCLEDAPYQTLFGTDGWSEAEKEANAAPFVQAFETYGKNTLTSFSKAYDRTLSALCDMLDFRHTQHIEHWEPATAPINGNTQDRANDDTRFKNRNVLPDVHDVISKAAHGL